MGDRIIGFKSLAEISGTVKGANEHCTEVFRKSFGAPPTQKAKTGDPAPKTPTESDMDMKITKALLGLNDAARGYAAGLEEDKLKSFLELDADARQAEVDTHVAAEKAKTDAAAAAEKAKAAGDPVVNALREEVETLKSAAAADKAKSREAELKETAKSAYPGVPTALAVLKSIEGLSEEQRQPVIDSLKAQQEMSKNFSKTFGADDAKEGSAIARHAEIVKTVAKEKSISKAEATVLVADDPEHAELISEMRAEMAEAD